MRFPKLENIESKYKKLYVVTVVLLLVAAVAFVVGSILMIVRGHRNPPVKMVTGRFGSFPIFRLCRDPKDKDTRIIAATIRGLDNVVNLTTGKVDRLDGVRITHDGKCAVADLRGFGPALELPGKWHNAALFFGIKLPKRPWGSAIIYYQTDVDADLQALAWLKWNRAQGFVLRKMIRGWTLGYKTILEEAFSFRSLGETSPNRFQPGTPQVLVPDAEQGPCWPQNHVTCGNVVIKIFDPIVVKELKVGIAPQMIDVLSRAGSFVYLATFLIGVLFVRKYAYGDFAVAYDTYTLRGMHVAQPVEMRDVPEVKALLLAEYQEEDSPSELLGGQGRFAEQQLQEEGSEEADGGYLGPMYDLVFCGEQEQEPPPPPPPRERPGSRWA
mmetsp:Transcript_90858/g.265999  ORF Transcript_90858/g.265999 Transcript_90858/m.265999 type:complete len:384 (+) Transcript_90858:111-1262(+)